MLKNISPAKQCVFYGLCGALVFTAATALIALLSKNYPFWDCVFRLVISLPWVATWILEGIVFSYHAYPDGGALEGVLANTLWIFIFIQWFIIGLVIACLFKCKLRQ